MKTQIDEYIKKYGNENTPPPWQTFTIGNEVRDGNVHLIQKVFDGAFEVSMAVAQYATEDADVNESLISYTHLALHPSPSRVSLV